VSPPNSTQTGSRCAPDGIAQPRIALRTCPVDLGYFPRPGAAARSITPTVAPHTLRVRYPSEDPKLSEIFSEMDSF
jgi:hypothetical protein